MVRARKNNESQDIEELKKRFQELSNRKSRTEGVLETSQRRLEELREQARTQYGTDDLEELKAKLEEMKKENERRRADYQKHLDEIEEKLANVEREHEASAEGDSGEEEE